MKRKWQSTKSLLMAALKKALKKVMPKRFGKHLNTFQDTDLISPMQSAILFLVINVLIFLLIIPLSGWQRSLTKNQKGEKSKRSISFKV